jgi:hypothetical protein
MRRPIFSAWEFGAWRCSGLCSEMLRALAVISMPSSGSRPVKKPVDHFAALGELLKSLLGHDVELVTPESLSPFLRPHILCRSEGCRSSRVSSRGTSERQLWGRSRRNERHPAA